MGSPSTLFVMYQGCSLCMVFGASSPRGGLRVRMCPVVRVHHATDRYPSVDLRGRESGVSKERAHGLQRRIVIVHVSAAGVA
jgi:hypothetical protein